MTDKLDVEAIRKRCEAATHGEWRYDPKGWRNPSREHEIFVDCGDGSHSARIAEALRDCDGDFIAHARQDIPVLLDALAALQAQLAQAKAEAWEDVARFGIEWMKNPGGIDARFIAACRENGAALRVKHEE